MHCGWWSNSCWWCWKRYDQVISHGQRLATHNHTHDTHGAPCITRFFGAKGRSITNFFLSIFSFAVRFLQPTKMVVITSEISSNSQPRTTEPLYSTLFCMRCQRGAGPSLCESWQPFHGWDSSCKWGMDLESSEFLIVPLLDPRFTIDATEGLRAWNLLPQILSNIIISSHSIKLYSICFYPIYSGRNTFRHPFDPSTLIPRNADLALQVSNIQQTRFQLDRKGLILLASNSALNLHFFMALPGDVIPIMIHDASLRV